MVPFERAMVVSYRLSIVTIALSVTIRPQFATESLRHSNQQRVGHFGAKFGEEGVNGCKPKHKLGEIWRCLMQKKFCRYLQPFEHSAGARMRQTNRQTGHG